MTSVVVGVVFAFFMFGSGWLIAKAEEVFDDWLQGR